MANTDLIYPQGSAEEAAQITRRRAIADALVKQSISGNPNRIQEAGGNVVPYSVGEGLTQLAQALIGRNMESQVDKQQAGLDAQKQAYVRALAGKMNVDPDVMSAAPEATMNAYTQSQFRKPDKPEDVYSDLTPQQAQALGLPRGNVYQRGSVSNQVKPVYEKKEATPMFSMPGGDANFESTAQAIASGRVAPPTAMSMRMPQGQALMARVLAINPDFDATTFGTKQKASKDFATGKQGQAVKSFNVALSHLGTLEKAADALNNGDYPLVNKVANEFGYQTGNDAKSNFEAVKTIVADELVKAIIGGGGALADREEAAKTVKSANSPQQLKGVIARYKELMHGQLSGLKQQYETSTNNKDFNRYLSPDAMAMEGDGELTPAEQTELQRLRDKHGAK